MPKIKFFFATIITLVSSLVFSQTTVQPSLKNAPSKEPLRVSSPYSQVVCTVYSSGFELLDLTFVLSIYSTYKVEPTCDANYFYNLTLTSIEAQSHIISGSSLTLRGGAHAYTMDVNLTPVTSKFFYIGNLRFSKLGEVRLSIIDAIKKNAWNVANVVNSPYTNFVVESKIHYIWNIGSLMHTLTAPNGDKYIMYAYTNEIATNLTRENLINLGSRLKLPRGWTFQNSLLSKTITVNPNLLESYQSLIIFDEFNNFYVKYSP